MRECSYCQNSNVEGSFIINTWDGFIKEDVEFSYCSDNCKNNISKHISFATANIKKFIIGIVICVIINFISVAFGVVFKNINFFKIIALVMMAIGIIICKYAISTPYTNRKFGIKKTVKIVKLVGISTILIGVIFLIAMCYFPKVILVGNMGFNI